MISRELYIEEIRPFMGSQLIKILTGIRRCGKSTLLELLREEFVLTGVSQDDLLYINLEGIEFLAIEDAEDLLGYIKPHLHPGRTLRLLMDEIQRVRDWEKAVNVIFASGQADIYLTGSNSKLLSSELATYLSGRYVLFTIQPLSFREFLQFDRELRHRETLEPRRRLQEYLELGGFPVLHHIADLDTGIAYKTLRDIYASVILRDVVERNGIRNVDTLERLLKFIFDNQGNLFSAKRISIYLKNQGRKLSEETVYHYIAALEAAFVIQKAPRYDVRGKGLLAVQEKYYAADNGLVNALLEYDVQRLPGMLENVVFHELNRHGYQVYVGKSGDREIDFVGIRQNDRVYVQTTYQLGLDKALIDREFGILLDTKDNYPKYVVSLDESWSGNIAGVKWLNLADFLLLDEY